jgi:hypothetical protein
LDYETLKSAIEFRVFGFEFSFILSCGRKKGRIKNWIYWFVGLFENEVSKT